MTRVLLALLALLIGACAGGPRIPGLTPYRIDIQQGNFVSQDMVAQLKPGMSKEQVRFVLGTPLLTDIFHGDRWDYVYWREASSGKREQRKLAVFFADGKLTRLDGDIAAAGGATRDPK
jgi:outer membrane protein assembly factor BamE